MKNHNCEGCKHYVRKAKEPYKSIGDAFRACELSKCHFEPISICNFRRVFQPTEEEKKQDELQFKKIWDEAKKKRNCITCANSVHVRKYPDFVTGEEYECLEGLQCDTILDSVRNCKKYKEVEDGNSRGCN